MKTEWVYSVQKNTMDKRISKVTSRLRECRDRASGLGVRPGQRWTFPFPGCCTERGVLFYLGAPSSSHVYRRFGKVKKDLGGKGPKTPGEVDE